MSFLRKTCHAITQLKYIHNEILKTTYILYVKRVRYKIYTGLFVVRCTFTRVRFNTSMARGIAFVSRVSAVFSGRGSVVSFFPIAVPTVSFPGPFSIAIPFTIPVTVPVPIPIPVPISVIVPVSTPVVVMIRPTGLSVAWRYHFHFYIGCGRNL